MMDDIKPVLKQIFRISDAQVKNLTYAKMTGYSDNIIANIFEGIDMGVRFSQNQLMEILQSVQYNLVKPFTHEFGYE